MLVRCLCGRGRRRTSGGADRRSVATGAGGLWDGAVKGVQDAGKGVQGFSEQALQATGEVHKHWVRGSRFCYPVLLLEGSSAERLFA